MNNGLIYLLVINFIYIGILPRIFFKKDGRYNLMWFITAAPLFFNSILIFCQYMGWINLNALVATSMSAEILAVLLSASSIAFIAYTMGTHRVPLALWHQTNDAPVHLVTWGAYKYVRHPFYVSFILAQIASVLTFAHPLTLLGLLCAVLILNHTAAREERKLSESEFGTEYQSYMKKAGRFTPKLGS